MDIIPFATKGLLLTKEEAEALSIAFSNCLKMGLIAGAGVAFAVARDQANTSGSADQRLRLLSILVGFAVGGATVGMACKTVQSKILDYLNGFPTIDAAIDALDAQRRNELRDEALKLIQAADAFKNSGGQLDNQFLT